MASSPRVDPVDLAGLGDLTPHGPSGSLRRDGGRDAPPGPLGPALRVGVALGALAGATALFHYVVPANPTTVALSYLLLVLLAATEWGLLEATVLAAAASLAYNFFFLPPVGRLTIAEPENLGELRRLHVDGDRGLAALGPRPRPPPRRGGPPARPGAALHPQPRPAARGRGRGALRPASPVTSPMPSSSRASPSTISTRGRSFARAGPTCPTIDARLRDAARQATTRREPGGLVVTTVRLGQTPIGSLALHGRHDERHGAAVGGQPRRHRPGAGA